jgi:hypothetical protein
MKDLTMDEVKEKRKMQKEWDEFVETFTDFTYLIGGLLFIPTAGIIYSILCGLRTGLRVGTQKFLDLLVKWEACGKERK